MLPKSLDFLQGDDVGVFYGICNAFKVNLLIKAKPKMNIIANELHYYFPIGRVKLRGLSEGLPTSETPSRSRFCATPE
jgi:hypothetical protein